MPPELYNLTILSSVVGISVSKKTDFKIAFKFDESIDFKISGWKYIENIIAAIIPEPRAKIGLIFKIARNITIVGTTNKIGDIKKSSLIVLERLLIEKRKKEIEKGL